MKETNCDENWDAAINSGDALIWKTCFELHSANACVVLPE